MGDTVEHQNIISHEPPEECRAWVIAESETDLRIELNDVQSEAATRSDWVCLVLHVTVVRAARLEAA
jgi:hypothetical protein